MRFLAIIILVLCHIPASAQIIVKQPPDLESGDKYRLMFLTSKFRDGTSGDIDDYNNFVQSVADTSPEIGPWNLEWRAIASTSDVDARDNTGTNPSVGLGVPIYGVHGAILASNYELLWNSAENRDNEFSMNITELGTALSLIHPDDQALFAWTGSDENGTAYMGSVGGIQNGFLGAERPVVGRAAAPPSALIFANFHHQSRAFPLFAMSEVLTAVPEPSAGFSAMFALLVTSTLRHSRRKFARNQ